MKIDLTARCKKLDENKTFQNLFELTCENPSAISALYIDNGEDVKLCYADSVKMTYAAAKTFSEAFGDSNKGRFVAISLDTCPEWFPIFWGLLAAGYNALLLDPMLNDEMTSFMLDEAGAVAIISAKKRNLETNTLYLKDIDFARNTDGFKLSFADKIAICTSGTTATSRIFVYDQSAVCEQVLNSLLIQEKNTRIVDGVNRRALAFLPFHHVFGLVVNLLWAHFIGYETVYLKNRAAETILYTCRHFNVVYLATVPVLANSLSTSIQRKLAQESRLKRFAFNFMKSLSIFIQRIAPESGADFAKNVLFGKLNDQLLGRDIECIILGGSHTPNASVKMLSSLGYFTICGFGLTETAITSVETSKRLGARISGSVGRPMESVEYKVNSENSNTGELLIRGKSLHTAQLKGGNMLPPTMDKDGWYATGDIVRLEKGNRMFIEGRSKDIIVNESGENIYPDEIEDHFQELHGVNQICVLGLNLKKESTDSNDELGYEDIALVLSVGDLYSNNEYLSHLNNLVYEQNSQLPVMKKITRVIVSPEKFDMSNGIKVKRLALKKRIESKSIEYKDLDMSAAKAPDKKQVEFATDKDNSELKNEILQKVCKAYAETLGIDEKSVTAESNFIDDLGGDSLQLLSVMLKIEEQFGIRVDEEEYGRCITANSIADLLIEKMNGEETNNSDRIVTPISSFEETEEYKAFVKRNEQLLGSGKKNPYFVCHESALTDKSLMDGKMVLNFGSYNYVGMSGRKETKEAAKKAIDKYGTSASGSRLLAGEKKLYQELEKEIADWKHSEDALVLVGGHSTNVTIVGNFCGKNDLILYDALAHNSIAQGCQLSRAECRAFPHNDMDALENILKMHRSQYEKVLIIVEGAYSMDGDVANVPALVKLKKKYGCFLMVDEAHSACVLGKTGGGVDEYFHLEQNDIDIKMGTLSKGLGACGGYLAGKRSLIEYLRYNLPGFVFSVGISPPLAAACLEAIRLLRNDPSIIERLHENIDTFVNEAHARNMNTCLAGESAIIPILIGGDEEAFMLSNLMSERGVFVPPAVYPAVPRGKARLRFCVNSEHTKEEIIEALDTLLEICKENGIVLPK